MFVDRREAAAAQCVQQRRRRHRPPSANSAFAEKEPITFDDTPDCVIAQQLVAMYASYMPSSPERASKLVESARRAFSGGDFANAEALYQDAIAAFLRSKANIKAQLEAYIGLADCVDARGGDSQALRALIKTIQGAD
jgi:hypothetical protein